MFVDLPAPPQRVGDFPSEPLTARLQPLVSGRRKVAYVYWRPDTGSFRYRAYNMVDCLNALDGDDVSAAWFTESELGALERFVPQLDALVLVRYPHTPQLQCLVDRARLHGVRVVFDTDDLVFDSVHVPLLFDALGWDARDHHAWHAWHANTALLAVTMGFASQAITTTGPLAAQLERHFPGAVTVMPNFLHRGQELYSRQLLQAKRDQGWRREGPITIGYFSGSPTHARDFALAVPALVRLMSRHADVRLRLVGHLLPIGQLAQFEDRIDYVEFMDFLQLQRSIAEVEINIAPLQHHEFANCKSELKWFEAAAVGTWTVASASDPFLTAIEDRVTGRVVRAHLWDEALESAVALVRDPEAYARHAELAATSAYSRYGCDSHGERLRQVLLDDHLPPANR